MSRYTSRLPLLTLLAVLVPVLISCGSEAELTPTTTPAPSPTATRPSAARQDPDETPVPPLVTESALVDIRRRGVLRVGVLYNYPPIAYLADNGEVHGYEVALVRQIAERWGVEVTFVQVTRQTRLPMLQAGEVDILAGAMPHRRDLEQFVEFSSTIFRSGYVVMVPSDSGISEIAAIGDGPVAAIGPEAQDAFNHYATVLGITPSIQAFDLPEDASTAFEESAVGAVVGRREIMMRMASSTEGAEIINEFVLVEPYALAVRRGDTPLRDLIDLTLQSIAADGTYGELFSANFYAFAPDVFPALSGESAYTFDTFPADIPESISAIERIRRSEPLRVGGMELAAEPVPYDGQPVVDGYNRAIVNELARRWNVPVIEVPDSAGEKGLSFLRNGQVDLVVGVRPDLAFLGQIACSLPYYQRGLRLIHMRDVTVQGVGDLEFKPALAVDPVDISQDLIEDNNSFPDVRTIDSLEGAFETLVARAVYAMVGDEYSLMLMTQADETIAVDERLYRPANHVMAILPYDADFLALINFTLQDMKADGTLDRLQQQYFAMYMPAGSSLEPFPMELWPGDGSYLGVGGSTN